MKETTAQQSFQQILPIRLELPGCFSCCHGQFVTAFVFCVAGVPFDDGKSHVVAVDELVQHFPLFNVGDRLQTFALLPLPTVLFPVMAPRTTAISDIFAVGDDLKARLARKIPKAFDNGLQLHSIVSRLSITAAKLGFLATGGMSHNARPAARARITSTRAVGEDLHKWQCRRR